MNKWERIKYQLAHRAMVLKVYKHNFGVNPPLNIILHDLDKIPYVIFTDKSKKEIKLIHKRKRLHHIDTLRQFYDFLTESQKENYVIEMLCDWEAGRFTKPDKPETALGFWESTWSKLEMPAAMRLRIEHKLNYIKYGQESFDPNRRY